MDGYACGSHGVNACATCAKGNGLDSDSTINALCATCAHVTECGQARTVTVVICPEYTPLTEDARID